MTDEAITILIAEDNPADTMLTGRALKQMNHHFSICTVTDGAEALDFIFMRANYYDRTPKDLPHMIILDLKMPKIGGLDVLKQIRATPAAQYLPVIVFTSSSQDQDINECYRAGANAYIVKPIDLATYIAAIQNAVEKWLTQVSTQG